VSLLLQVSEVGKCLHKAISTLENQRRCWVGVVQGTYPSVCVSLCICCVVELNHSVSSELLGFCFYFFFLISFVSGPCARLSWPARQLCSAR